MRVHMAAITACGVLLAAGAKAGGGHFAVSVRIGGGAPLWYGPCGYGFALYPPAATPAGYGCGPIFSPSVYGSYRSVTCGYHASGWRVASPRAYDYAHRGYDRYGYSYGEYHYPGRHYSYSYGGRFYQIRPHATFVIRGGHIRDYGRRGGSWSRHYGHGWSVYYGHAYRSHRRTAIHRRTTRHIGRR